MAASAHYVAAWTSILGHAPSCPANEGVDTAGASLSPGPVLGAVGEGDEGGEGEGEAVFGGCQEGSEGGEAEADGGAEPLPRSLARDGRGRLRCQLELEHRCKERTKGEEEKEEEETETVFSLFLILLLVEVRAGLSDALSSALQARCRRPCAPGFRVYTFDVDIWRPYVARKAWMPYFGREGRDPVTAEALQEYTGSYWKQADELELLVLTGEDLHAAALAKKATSRGLDGWGWNELKVFFYLGLLGLLGFFPGLKIRGSGLRGFLMRMSP